MMFLSQLHGSLLINEPDSTDVLPESPILSVAAPAEVPAANVDVAPFFILPNNSFAVVTNISETPPVHRVVADLDQNGYFIFDKATTSVIIEVGTNDDPDMGQLLKVHKNMTLIGFEPQPEVYSRMVRNFRMKSRLLAIPAAVTPTKKFSRMYVSAHNGCTSMLSMNDRARHFAKQQGKRAPRKSSVIQLRTLEYCANVAEQILVPSFPLDEILKRISPSVTIDLLMVDAQGFDIHVASTIGRSNRDRVRWIILECQDLSPGHLLFLVNGAPSCDQQRRCFEAAMPHRLQYCWDNAPKVREYNCLYRHPSVPEASLPKGLKVVSQPREIFYPTTKEFECPNFM
jgi:FkbM family methyltransferase